MHIAETYCYVETVRPDGTLCAPGELGNVIVTSLHSHAMPIIRLEPGDVARIIEDPCTCGRRSRRIQHEGRIQACMRVPDGRWVTGREVWDRLLFVKGLELFQLIQRSIDRALVRVIESPGESLDKDDLMHHLLELMGPEVTFDIQVVPSIKPERSGKIQLVKSNTFEDFRVKDARRKGIPVN